MINFFSEDIDFSLENQAHITSWINKQSSLYNAEIQLINYVFCSDEFLLNINNEHLGHDYFTDIITFDMRDAKGQPIEADIFISIDRVKENAIELNRAFEEELHRVIIHGLLHIIGYSDKTEVEKRAMREKEDACLSLR